MPYIYDVQNIIETLKEFFSEKLACILYKGTILVTSVWQNARCAVLLQPLQVPAKGASNCAAAQGKSDSQPEEEEVSSLSAGKRRESRKTLQERLPA